MPLKRREALTFGIRTGTQDDKNCFVRFQLVLMYKQYNYLRKQRKILFFTAIINIYK